MTRFVFFCVLCISTMISVFGNSVEEIKSTPQVSEKRISIDDPDFSTFVKAIQQAGLSDIFVGTGPFTAFIPSNAAFEKFGKSKWEAMLKPEKSDQLVDLLIYHIVPGKYMAENLQTRQLKTINGKLLEIKVEGDKIWVNEAKVTRTNLTGPNGVIHEIDSVLSP